MVLVLVVALRLENTGFAKFTPTLAKLEFASIHKKGPNTNHTVYIT